MHTFHIAIDGPAGSGKSSISKVIAKQLKCIHLDTGAMYRAVTLLALEKNIDLNDTKAYDFLNHITMEYINDRIFVDKRDITDAIRHESVTKHVSLVSSIESVRNHMVYLQQQVAKKQTVVMDGRDIGTVVLPDAFLKIFLTAAIEERAKRRIHELKKDIPLEVMIEDIRIRDYKDSNRLIAPLTKASDAIVIDTTYLTQQEVVDTIILEYKKRIEHYAKH
jgi:cytidylate kinase/small subunit ribosomal protein S1